MYIRASRLVPIIANAPANAKLRNAWLERLFHAYQEDAIPYLRGFFKGTTNS